MVLLRGVMSSKHWLKRNFHYGKRDLSQPPATSISPPSPSSAKPGNLKLKSQKSQDLEKPGSRVWKRWQLLPQILCLEHTFLFFIPSEICKKEMRYSKRPLNFMQLSVLLYLPTGPCNPIQASSGHWCSCAGKRSWTWLLWSGLADEPWLAWQQRKHKVQHSKRYAAQQKAKKKSHSHMDWSPKAHKVPLV